MNVLSFLLMLVIGGLAGWSATKLLKTDKQSSTLTYVLLGVIGAIVGNWLIELVGFEVVGDGLITSFAVSFIGAVVLVGLSKLIAGKVLK